MVVSKCGLHSNWAIFFETSADLLSQMRSSTSLTIFEFRRKEECKYSVYFVFSQLFLNCRLFESLLFAGDTCYLLSCIVPQFELYCRVIATFPSLYITRSLCAILDDDVLIRAYIQELVLSAQVKLELKLSIGEFDYLATRYFKLTFW